MMLLHVSACPKSKKVEDNSKISLKHQIKFNHATKLINLTTVLLTLLGCTTALVRFIYT